MSNEKRPLMEEIPEFFFIRQTFFKKPDLTSDIKKAMFNIRKYLNK